MRITKHTDYALRVLLYLAARPDERVSTHTIAEAYDISQSHLLKIVRRMVELGLLNAFRGTKGGIELARAADEISVGEVMRALDDQDSLIECFSEMSNTCVVASGCGLKPALRAAQEAFYSTLDPVMVGALTRRRADLLRQLTGGPSAAETDDESRAEEPGEAAGGEPPSSEPAS